MTWFSLRDGGLKFSCFTEHIYICIYAKREYRVVYWYENKLKTEKPKNIIYFTNTVFE